MSKCYVCGTQKPRNPTVLGAIFLTVILTIAVFVIAFVDSDNNLKTSIYCSGSVLAIISVCIGSLWYLDG